MDCGRGIVTAEVTSAYEKDQAGYPANALAGYIVTAHNITRAG